MQRAVGFWGTPREWATDLAVATGIGVFLGVIGPYGSFNGGGLELRIFYWVASIWLGYLILSTVVRAAVRAAGRFDLPMWFAIAVSAAIGALPLAVVGGWFSALVWPPSRAHVSNFPVLYAQTLALSEPLAFAYVLLVRRGLRAEPSPREAAPPPDTAAMGAPSFLNRLPPRLGRTLLCLQMEDHYVRAHTDRGSELILMPLKQAIADLQETEGMQVHRSWWVARDAVVEPVRNGRSLGLRLTNGLVVPVSRSSVAALREAGWLGPPGS